MLLLYSANDEVARALEKQRSVKDRQRGHEREQAETNSSEPPARTRLCDFDGRGHAVRIGTITAANSGSGLMHT